MILYVLFVSMERLILNLLRRRESLAWQMMITGIWGNGNYKEL